MSTDPGPTPGPEKAPEAPADAGTDLVEENSPPSHAEGEAAVQSDLEVTPLVSPPVLGDPSPPPLGPTALGPIEGDAAEKPESAEEESPTNLAYEEWAGFLGNRAMVDPLLSRLRHFCHTIKIDGPSLRTPETP